MTFSRILKSRAWYAAWRTFCRAFILLGLPLLAWGLTGARDFLAQPARAAYAGVALLQAAALGWLVYVTPLRDAPERDYDLSHWHAHIYELILIVAAYGDRRSVLAWGELPALRWVGVAFALLSTVLGVWASVTWSTHLRREGVAAALDPVLLTVGPFRWIRYPVLVCVVLMAAGVTLLMRSWLGVALLLPLAGACAQRIRFLERDNAGRYGRNWLARTRTSWRAVPFLY